MRERKEKRKLIKSVELKLKRTNEWKKGRGDSAMHESAERKGGSKQETVLRDE